MRGERRIGLMGGTFDPIHYGHLFLAEEALAVCGLERVIFVPNSQPAHREGKTACAGAESRFALVQMAIADNSNFEITRLEIDRPGPSYAYDTLLQLAREFGPSCELYFVMGIDSLQEVLTWHRGAGLFELCRFVAATRPGFDVAETKALFSPEQLKQIIFMEVPGLHLASREIRRRVGQALPIRYLVPGAVESAIRDWDLYRASAVNSQGAI